MIEAVFVFAAVTALFETIILLKVPVYWRLRILGSPMIVGVIHLFAILANLWVHWGTITGTMTAIVAGLSSFGTIPAVRWYVGYIHHRRYYPGIKRYDPATIK
jgi:hypothetical protein